MRLRARFWLRFFFGLVGVVHPAMAFGQVKPCGPEELTAVVPANALIYPETAILAKKLGGRGILVNCVLLSKMEGLFVGQDGAALYRTDRGDFEVLFLHPGKSFELLKIVERRDGSRYAYNFTGPPEPASANIIESGNAFYFLKHQNMLVVLRQKELADTMEKVFHQ